MVLIKKRRSTIIFIKLSKFIKLALYTRNYLCWSLCLNKVAVHESYNSNTAVFLGILKNFYKHLFWRTSAYGCFWSDFRKSLFKTFFSEQSLSKPSWLRVILQKYKSFSNQSFKQNSAHMPSLNLTPTLSCEPRFRLLLLTVTTEWANAWKAWRFVIATLPLLFSTPFPKKWEIWSKKNFYRPLDSSVNTSQLFVAIQVNFSGLFFFWISRSKEEFSRDFMINAATCSFAYR